MPYLPKELVTESFIAGLTVLYQTVKEYPGLSRVPIDRLDLVRNDLNRLGYNYRTRYRGPKSRSGETLKRNARAFTIYFQE
jgi:hypothetical protein